MDHDGFTCAPCPESSSALVVMSCFVFLVIVLVFGALVYLKIRNYTSSSEAAKSKSAHVTVKRIILSHMQVIMLCMQLNVPWPSAIQTMMTMFSSMSSLSNHLSALSCLFLVDESPVRKQAKFLYATTQFVMTFPIAFTAFIWLYWLVLVPLRHCKCLSCGNFDKLYMSDPRPGCLKKKNEARVSRRRASGGFTAARDSNLDLSVLLKTRDVWVYSMMLYFYVMWPTLVRFPMYMLSCVKLHTSDFVFEEYGNLTWVQTSYLRHDVEEICWRGEHLANALAIALPGFLAYGIGLPLMAFMLLYSNRDQLYDKKYTFRLGLLYLGFREKRWWWEGITASRKLGIIMLSAFAHDDSLQLHFTLATLIVAFALHSTYHPFDIVSKASLADGDDDEDSHKSCCLCCCGGGERSEGVILHRMERNSIIISILLLWSAVVFILAPTCTSGFCYFLSNMCIVFLILFNLLFLWGGGRNFIKMLYKVATERRLAREGLRMSKGADSMDFAAHNPAFNVEMTQVRAEALESQVGGGSTGASRKTGDKNRSNSDGFFTPVPPSRPSRPPQPGEDDDPSFDSEGRQKRSCCHTLKCCGYGACTGVVILAQDMS
jgi:hypothetical protein